MTTPTQLPLQQLEGILERVTFQNEENGYTVARLKCHGQTKEVTIVGTLSGANVGERLRLVGFWTNHPSYGRQFEVNTFSVHYPATVEGIRKYLGSGLVRGIGPVTAGKIVDVFGVDTLTVIEEEPHRLKEINGIGDKKIHVISQAWSEQKQIKEIMLFLQSHSVSSGLAVKIYMQYGDQSIPIVKADPYRLAKDIYGIGFITADRIARQLGLPPDSPARIRAGLSYCLSEFANDGNCFANRTQLLSKAKDLLNVDDCAVELQNLLSGEELLEEDDAIYLPAFFHAETGVANRIHRLQHSPQDRLSHLKHIDLPASIADFSNTSPIQLTDLQTQAVRMALTEKTSVLTGGPGTGKSTIIAAIIHILQRNRGSILLTAPTGRAAKRMTETTGIDARTIHRLLEYRPKEGKPFIRDNVNPLDADLIVVDEASMIDILLANHLLDAIEIGSHILFVGDVDQLPSVGPGNFLRDLIASNQVPVTRLDTIFRQAQDSYIILNAHRINTGLSPQFPANAADFFLFAESDPTKAADRVIELVSERIPNKFNFDPLSDIQVLCPMHRGSVGVTELNLRLQAKLNPSIPGKTELIHRHHQFRQGDRVMQIMNDYDLQVFNGDLGRITRIDLEDQVCQVDFDGRIVEYSFSALDELSHAYAVSIHKSQGSEFPVVVIPILTQHYLMLQRNLLYTAVTRARKLVVLVGSKEAIAIAVRNNRITQRNTRLAQRINKQTNRNSVSNSAEYSFAKQPKGSRK
jgi:exodeoxyribonuclease V alpha subunit